MPIVPYKLDVGFDEASTFQPDIPKPEGRGGGFFQFGANWHNTMEDLQQAPALFGAAFDLENDVSNAIKLMSTPTFAPDPNFNLEANLKEAGLWDEYRWNYVGVDSPAEFLWKTRKIQTELKARKLLQSAGSDGVVASIIAGAASPTILLPFVGAGAKGAKAVATGLAWGAVGGALQEVPLQLNQELRTLEESGVSIGFSTILGGVLGGAAGFLNKGLERTADDIYNPRGGKYITASEERILTERRINEIGDEPKTPELAAEKQQLTRRVEELQAREVQDATVKAQDEAIAQSAIGRPASAGAAALDTDAGGLKGMLGIGERLTKLAGPVTAVLGQKISAQGRRMMAQLSTAGLRLEKNLVLDSEGNIIGSIPSNAGGTVEGIINSRRGDLLRLTDDAYRNFADYWYGSGKKPGAFRESRAYAAALLNKGAGNRLNRRQFFEEVGKAMRNGDQHAIPEVQATAQQFRGYYDKLLKEAQDAGIIPEEIRKVAPDLSFLNRVYDTEAILRRPNKFMGLLRDHFENQLSQDLERIHTGWAKSDARDAQALADFELPLDKAISLRDQFTKELKALEAAEDDNTGPIEELINGIRSDMRALTTKRKALEKEKETATYARSKELDAEIENLKSQRQVLRDGINDLNDLGGPDMEARQLRRRELKARIRNLNRSRYMVEERARKKFDQIDALEEQNVEALHRVVLAGNRAMKALDKQSNDFEKELSAMQAAVNKAGGTSQRLRDQLDELRTRAEQENARQNENPEAEPNDEAKILSKIFTVEKKAEENSLRFKDAWDNLATLENVNWTERGLADARGAVQDALDESLRQFNYLITRRAQRQARLEKQAEKFDKGAWEIKRAEVAERRRLRTEEVRERVHNLGGDDYDMATGRADFTERSKEIAQIAYDRVTGANLRLAGFDAMADKRGTELARTLSIDSNILAREGFLIDDAEHLAHVYNQTLVPDIELTNRLGAFSPDGERNVAFKELNEERTATLEKNEADFWAKHKERTPELERKLELEQRAIGKEYEQIHDNLDATIRRLRGNWGIPAKPDGFAARGVQIVLSAQALRFLGTVGISSIPDVSKPIMRYGLLRTMSKAWIPMITNFASFKMTMAEARRAFVAVESATAQRAFQAADLMYRARSKTKFEAGLQWFTSKFGIIAGFAPWTDVMKTISTMALNSKMLDSVDLALNKAGSSAERKEAIEFLASLGWDEDMQRRIWDQMQDGGARQFNGTWVPQTDNWTDEGAVKAYRAALYSEGSASVITPGVELNKIVNASLPAKLLFNLKSFALASTSKTLMAGLQQRDAAVLNGVLMSLALGALSFYLRSIVSGGASEARMRKSIEEGNWELWVDEAFDASGLLGALQIGAQIGQDIPGVKNVSSIGNVAHTLQGEAPGGSARSSSSGLIEDVAGPTADLAFTTAQIIAGLDKVDRSQVHRVRQLLPLQNHFVLRRLFDQLENSVGDQFNLKGQPR